ncbi:DUF6146 family protein [Winogradskyella forsetii]|uniref:DUF6146 family protein n=1 Tax=Winogradskyella forsetii TaxID=2686077 RepID=UPI001E648E5D|nr:DUF6146 family protein [Winogradskyella forsetii]
MKHPRLKSNPISYKYSKEFTRTLKTLIPFVVLLILIASCKSYNTNQTIDNGNESGLVENDTVSISSDESDYEIIIIEPGFNAWLIGTARPEGYYSQQFLESRNAILVQAWNQRNMQPMTYDPNLYELRIDYDTRTDYGYEVNYKLYNYFVYFQLKYKQRLSSFLPRI